MITKFISEDRKEFAEISHREGEKLGKQLDSRGNAMREAKEGDDHEHDDHGHGTAREKGVYRK